MKFSAFAFHLTLHAIEVFKNTDDVEASDIFSLALTENSKRVYLAGGVFENIGDVQELVIHNNS